MTRATGRGALPRAMAVALAIAAYAGGVPAQDGKPAPAAKPAAAPAPKAAQPPAPKPAQASRPPPKPNAQGANCPQGAQCARGGQRRASTVPPPTTAEQMAALEPASEAQLEAATQVHYGKYVCDEKFEVFVEPNAIRKGYVDVRYKRDVWVMRPVASSTGAVRLEDTRGRVLLVQIPFKSMLLNTQTGQRIVDACQHDIQKDAQRDAERGPKSETTVLK